MPVSILCPTRARPTGFARMVDSARLSEKPVKIYAGVDSDDETLSAYDFRGIDVTISEGKTGTAKQWDILFKKARGDYFVMMADDAVFRTQNWDRKMASAFKLMDDLALLFFDNGNGRAIPEQMAVSRKWIELVEPFIFPQFEHFYLDQIIIRIAMACDRLVRVPQIMIEHLHPKYGKAPVDESYKSKRTGGLHQRDKERYAAAEPEIVEIINRTRQHLEARIGA